MGEMVSPSEELFNLAVQGLLMLDGTRVDLDPGAVRLLTLPELGVGRLVCLGVGKVERLPLRPVARELLRDNAALWGLADHLGLHHTL